jgi:23S rRNA (adenine1618-N6)-methyltransferase
LHPRNQHLGGYDFARLTALTPELARFVRPTGFGGDSIDFANAEAVVALNRALLRAHYGVADWQIPPGYLCPPVPGRADYIHHLADLLAERPGGAVPRGDRVAILDIGVGANCIYPIIGRHEYGWSFVGTEVDPAALASARRIVAANPGLAGAVDLRLQPDPAAIFRGVVQPSDRFAACLCNPPFHASSSAAAAGTRRKLRNLQGGKPAPAPALNFGGRSHELWYEGGELEFGRRMIRESAHSPRLCGWFTLLVSQRDHVPLLESALRATRATAIRVLPLEQGQKKSRLVAWSYA